MRIGKGGMGNGTALVLALLVVGALAADQFLLGGAGAFFLAQRFMTLLEWVTFWR